MFRDCIPYAGSIELTHRCNLSCLHCYQFPPRRDEMDTAQWIGIFRDLAEAGCLFLAFTGGEPLLREDLPHLLSAAADLNFVLTLQTNATLLDRRLAAMMGEIPTLRVDVSLYGAKPSTHDALTAVEGSHAATRRGLELLREHDVPVMLKVTVGNFNVDEMEDIAAFGDELGIKAIFSSLIFPRNDCDPAPTHLRLDDSGVERFMRFEKDYMLATLGEIMGIDSGDITRDDMAAYLRKCAIGPDKPGSEQRRYCGGGTTNFAINPYGDVYPCVAFPLVVGNIQEDKFLDVWKNSPDIKALRSREDKLPDECGECAFLDKCAICRALSFLEEGDVIALSRERCRQTKILMKVLSYEEAR
jgi:radical SAM protein with 4Fe4S-binding SPASM domain